MEPPRLSFVCRRRQPTSSSSPEQDQGHLAAHGTAARNLAEGSALVSGGRRIVDCSSVPPPHHPALLSGGETRERKTGHSAHRPRSRIVRDGRAFPGAGFAVSPRVG